MREFRNFENDPIQFPYEQGKTFLDKLHQSGRHYVPILDTGIYVPSPNNASDS